MRTVITLRAPSAWAPFLINEDSSGLTDEEVNDVRDWLEWADMGWPVSCEDAGFCWNFDHPRDDRFDYAADCQTYTFLVEEGA